MRHVVVVLALAVFSVGCTASGASTGNFELTPDRVGWYVGDEAKFTLNLTPSLTRTTPDFIIDRNFAIEELRFEERGVAVGGDYKTRSPDDLGLRLEQGGVTAEEFALDQAHPGVDVFVTLPDALKDSEYVFEVKLFTVGWVKSAPFRVDER